VGEEVLLPLVLVPHKAELVVVALEALDCTGQELLVRLLQALVLAAPQGVAELGF
jgi:hypothetical protein